ncbi:MAG: endo alpha-1,4 polygalactosaminidase [Polyangiales bacterium]
MSRAGLIAGAAVWIVACGSSTTTATSDAGTTTDASIADAGSLADGAVDAPSADVHSGVDAPPDVDAPASDVAASDTLTGDASTATWWRPPVSTTFFWELANAPPDNSKNVGAYDVDGFGNDAAEVAALHALGLKVVCYMDAGTYEPGRPDSSSFPAALKGSGVSGWPGELWLDVRPSGPSYAALQAIMIARFKICQSKGFDAVEPDNIDSYQNSPGFPTTAGDQLAYDEWIATTVHSLGMAVFQKNDLDQIGTLLPYFDGLLNEECNKFSECDKVAPYVTAAKPVWNAEYQDDGESTASFCPADVTAGIVGALFSLNLDGTVFSPCSNDVGKIN